MRERSETDLTGLRFLADGLVGHHVPVHLGSEDELAWTDSREIHVAASGAADTRLALLTQACLIAAGSIDATLMLRLVGRPGLTRRYLSVEGRRAVRACSSRLPRRLLDHPELAPFGRASTSPHDSLAIAQGQGEIPEPGALLGALRPGAALRTAARGGGSPTSARKGADPANARKEAMLAEDEEAEGSRILDKFSSPFGGGGPVSDFFKRLIGMGAQRGGDSTDAAGAGEDRADGGGHTLARGASLRSNGMRRTDQDPSAKERTTAVRYPEWDAHIGRYRLDHVHVEEFVPWDEERAANGSLVLGPASAEMRRQVLRLGLGYERHRGQSAGDEIVVDDLVRLVVDVRAGHVADQRIYRGLRKTRRDLGVLVLIDCSASTADLTPEGRTVQDRQIALGWDLAQALDLAGDRVALYGFNSWGRERVHMLRVKGFDDPFAAETRRRVALLPPVGFTRIGAALRHAARLVRSGAGMPFRLVVLITDGLSYDDGYEAGYGEADTRKAISELQAENIATLCLSVGGEADDGKLARVFGGSAFLRDDDASAVTRQIGRLLGTAMAGVSHR